MNDDRPIIGSAAVDNSLGGEMGGDVLPVGEEEQVSSGLSLKDILLAPTGDGDISEYKTHPLNYDSSSGLAQVLRGFTGIVKAVFGLDNIKLALADILLGFTRWRKGAN